MEENTSRYPTVRLVDIEKEILKGKQVKPGILDEDILPGPSDQPRFIVPPTGTETVQSTPSTQTPVVNTVILNQSMPGLVSAPTNFMFGMSLTNVVQPTIIQPENMVKCVTAINPAPTHGNHQPSILRKPPQLITQTVPVEKMWSEIRNGVRFLHPSNLDHSILNKVTDTLKTKQSLKNTIISLPNSVYLVPISCFKGAQLPPDSMVSLASTNNGNMHTPPTFQKDTEVHQKLKHHCWNSKRNRKLDLEGFTAYDRLGFYKAETVRSRKCHRIIEGIIQDLTNSVTKIEEELSHIKTITSKELSRRWKRRRKSCIENIVSPTLDYSTSQSVSLNELRAAGYCTTATIDHTNFETFNQYNSCIFVNKDNVVTKIILDTFPDFKLAVEKGVVKIASDLDSSKQTKYKYNEDKFMQFVKYLKDNHSVVDIMNDHNYASSDSHTCVHNPRI